MNKLIITLSLAFIAITSWTAKAYPKPVTVTQSDGTRFNVMAFDDEPSSTVTKKIDGTTVTFVVEGAIEGDMVTVDLNAQGWASGKAVDPATITLTDGTKITFDKGEGDITPSFYDSTKGVRIYAKNTITISGKAVAKVVLYCDSYSGIGYVGNSTLYGSANGTTFVICNEYSENKGGDQLRVQKLDIIYAKTGTGTKPLPDDLEYVDLGLPSGTLWANMNLGANAITDFGDYYAWGEVEIKSNYSSKTYRFYDTWIVNDTTYIDDNGFTINEKGGTFSGFTKYVLKKDAEEYGYKGFYDNLTQLDVNDDAAYFNWGKEWRMPTKQQFLELINNCTWNWATINGKEGYKVTGITGNYIFLPAAGYRENDNPYHPGDVFYETQESNGGKIGAYLSSDIGYWSSYAIGLYIGSWVNNTQIYSINDYLVNGWYQGYRFRGLSIRAVYVGKNTFTISVSASGNGSAIYNGTTIRNDSKSFSVEEGTNTTVSFTPDNGYRIASVKVNNTDVTSQLSNNQYTVSNIKANTTVAVTFVENEYSSLTNDGVNYRVVSNSGKTVNVANGSYGYWLAVPATFTANGFEWSVTGIDNDVLSGNPQLAAVVWNPAVQFSANVSNPNFLLYVTSSQYAPSSIKNVVVGSTANSITLTDASSGNNFFCPQEFTARSISYSHSYGMTTGINEARGWESIALPFDVEAITHSSKGTLVPFTNWQEGGSTKPFWLYELGGSGFAEANSIKANTPYIISMPNNAEYKDEYRVAGTITFSSTDVTVKSSESLQNGSYSDRTFVPNFINQDASNGFYVLNAINNYSTNAGGYDEGSHFVRNLRDVHPFEAYITIAGGSAKESIPIFDDETTWIPMHQILANELSNQRIYNLNGQQIRIEGNENHSSLKKGIYIVNGKKIVVR